MIPSLSAQVAAAQAATAKPKNKGTQKQVAKAAELQQRILETIEDHGEVEATFIAARLRANISTVSSHMMMLYKKNRVEFTNTRPRKWRLR